MEPPLHWLGASALQARYAAGTATPMAVTEHLLARIAAVDPRLHSFVQVDPAGARRGAEASAARFAAGTARALEGVPVAVKANIAVAGLEWNAGMRLRQGILAEVDAPAVARLREAGAIILGTLNMHEAALGATSDNPFFGQCQNPHGEGRTPGGSSGGSGASVAAGLCAVSLGTDTLGSVRIPAAYNGIYGLKPSNGSITDEGVVPVSLWLDTIGPLARSIDDLEAAFRVIADSPPADATVFRRMLVLADFSDLEPEAAVVAAYDRALAILADLPRESWTSPHDTAAIRLAGFVVSTRELGGHLAEARQGDEELLSKELRFMLGNAEGRSEEEAEQSAMILRETRDALLAAIGADGVLVMPTTPQVAFAHTRRPPVSQSGFTPFANIAGLPALSLPAGRDAQGLPLAVQLVGPVGSELALLALGRRLDAELRGYAPPLID